ncbi:MAG: gfo/Idh/MocA family oxidoreductase, partial [Cyanobacteria bacterium J06648_10]
WFTPQNMVTQPVEVPPSEPLKNVCDHFVDCVIKNTPSTVSSGQRGTDLVSVLVALSESMNKAGAWITVSS